MFRTEDILAELAAGKSIETIAQDCANALNAAKAQYDKEEAERKAAAAKKAAELQKRKEKESRVTDIFEDVLRYAADFHDSFFTPAEIAAARRSFDAKAFVDAIDQTVAEIEKIPAIAEQLKKAGNKAGGPFEFSVELKNEDAKKAEDAIEKFLRENKLF